MASNCENIIKNFIAVTNDKIKCEENVNGKFICANTLNQFCEINDYDKKIISQISQHPTYFDYVYGEKNKKKFILIGHNRQ